MSTNFPIPKDYTSTAEALRRAKLKWGSDGLPQLLGLLAAGDLSGWRANVAGNVKKLDKSFWHSTDDALRAFNSDEIYKPSGERRLLFGGYESIGRPVFSIDELDKLLPPLADDASEATGGVGQDEGASKSNRGGRPPKATVDDFWIKAFQIIYEENTKNLTLKDFVDAMENWSKLQKLPGRYKRETIEKKLSKFWNRLEINR